jgi:hypothetical protein
MIMFTSKTGGRVDSTNLFLGVHDSRIPALNTSSVDFPLLCFLVPLVNILRRITAMDSNRL